MSPYIITETNGDNITNLPERHYAFVIVNLKRKIPMFSSAQCFSFKLAIGFMNEKINVLIV